VGRYRNPATVLHWEGSLPPGTSVEPLALATVDRAATTGTLYTVPGATRLVALMHPRVDVTHHYLVPLLLQRGLAVFTQRSRWVNNDAGLVHERVLLDVAAAHRWLRGRGFEEVVLLGNSGGASLYCLYAQQAALRPEDRLTDDPAGGRVDLTGDLPPPAALVLLAPHPGQGDLLLHCIDPSVTDEDDPGSCDPALDLYDPVNGFATPPASARYSPDFIARYRAAQRERVERIDRRARGLLELRRRLAASADAADGRRAGAARHLVVHRTDADPRAVDLSLDASRRDYGSIFGVRPDITNRGAVGFGRLSTPEAWLSTWSALSTRAAIRLTGPGIRIPALVIEYTADNTVYPGDLTDIVAALGSEDRTRVRVDGDHYGLSPDHTSRPGGAAVAELMADWLRRR
jgi:hypothetical protein